MKKILLWSLFAAAVLAGLGCAKKTEGVKPVNAGADGVALRGYDPVAYFREGRPVEGASGRAFEWNGATWRFSSDENRALFQSDPAKYAPQFGGYCSWAVSHGYTADADPQAWKIVDDKLYLNYNLQVREMWEKEQSSLIADGVRNWEIFKTSKPEHK